MSSPTNATISTAVGTGTIDDTPPTLSINNVTVTAPLTGTVGEDFTVTLSAASAQTVTVQYATSNGTATAPTDYTAASGTLTIAAGRPTGAIDISVKGDTLNNPPETYNVILSNPTNATIATGTGIGTIDDPPPTLQLSGTTVTAPLTGTTTANFTVLLGTVSNQAVSVNYATSDGTATAPTDYTASSGTVTIAPGQTSATIPITIQADTANNAPETFSVTLSSPTNATILTASATGTIDDIEPTVSINNTTVTAPFDRHDHR